MKRLIVIGITFLMLSVMFIPSASAVVWPTKGTWSAFPDDYSFWVGNKTGSADLNYSKTIDCPAGPGYSYGWSGMYNASNGARMGELFTPNVQVMTMYDNSSKTFNSRRAFIRFDLSELPVGGVVKNITFNITWSGTDHFNSYIVLANDTTGPPSYPLLLGDYHIAHYDLLGKVVSNQTFHVSAVTHYYFNSTGRTIMASSLNNTDPHLYITLMIIGYWERIGKEPHALMNNEGGTASQASVDMTIVLNGASEFILRALAAEPWPYNWDAEDMTGLLRTLLWFIGLGGMVIIPMMVIKTAREGEGGMAGKFNGSVFWIGMFIVCLAFFFWAIS
jgi:hypothetical protein